MVRTVGLAKQQQTNSVVPVKWRAPYRERQTAEVQHECRCVQPGQDDAPIAPVRGLTAAAADRSTMSAKPSESSVDEVTRAVSSSSDMLRSSHGGAIGIVGAVTPSAGAVSVSRGQQVGRRRRMRSQPWTVPWNTALIRSMKAPVVPACPGVERCELEERHRQASGREVTVGR